MAEISKKQGDVIKLEDFFAEIYGKFDVTQVPPTNSKSIMLLKHHYEELTVGSGLLPSTLARSGVRSMTNPEHIYHILSRWDKILKTDQKALRNTASMSRDGKALLSFFNPLMPDETHSKKDGLFYLAANGSCKPPLVWAPQAKVTDFNRPWLEEKYGREMVEEIEEGLKVFQNKEKQLILGYLAQKLEIQGFDAQIATLVATKLFNASGVGKGYNAMEDKSIPIEVTEGQKKIYCMAQGREAMMFRQILDTIANLSASMSSDQIESQLRGVDFIQPSLFVCTPGVWLMAKKNPNKDPLIKYVLNDSWKNLIDFSGRKTVMTWDADAAYNLDVAYAGSATGQVMRREFEGVDLFWRLYDEDKKIYREDGTPVKIGADDYIVHFGPESFFNMEPERIATGLSRDFIFREANKRSAVSGDKVSYIRFLQLLAKERSALPLPA